MEMVRIKLRLYSYPC